MKLRSHLPTLLLCASLLPVSISYAAEEATVVTINGKSISSETFDQYIAMRAQQVQLSGAISSEQRKLLLQEFINSELLYNAAVKAGIDQLPAVKAEIEMHTKNIIINNGVQKQLSDALTEAALREAYQQQYGQGTAEYHTRHILVKNESDANNILAALKRGEDFKRLAGVSSIDPSSSEGGDLGWLSTDQMPTTFATVVKNLKPGEYSPLPAKSRFGWHIILLEEQRQISPPPFEAVAEKIAQTLQGKVVKEYIDELRNNATIEIK